MDLDDARSVFSTPACSSSLASPGSCGSYCICLLILKTKKHQQKMIQTNLNLKDHNACATASYATIRACLHCIILLLLREFNLMARSLNSC
jgi:hypothetical protein